MYIDCRYPPAMIYFNLKQSVFSYTPIGLEWWEICGESGPPNYKFCNISTTSSTTKQPAGKRLEDCPRKFPATPHLDANCRKNVVADLQKSALREKMEMKWSDSRVKPAPRRSTVTSRKKQTKQWVIFWKSGKWGTQQNWFEQLHLNLKFLTAAKKT